MGQRGGAVAPASGQPGGEEALASTGDGVYTIGVSAEVTRSSFLSASYPRERYTLQLAAWLEAQGLALSE